MSQPHNVGAEAVMDVVEVYARSPEHDSATVIDLPDTCSNRAGHLVKMCLGDDRCTLLCLLPPLDCERVIRTCEEADPGHLRTVPVVMQT
ncbi:hypothetical protein DIPPA_35236 [Diplonema papillatum]|nr:hypothetical protein DIPPA_07230 [Diplonema papillatum]KAJ9439175.1 hypothetical protein DIPPA_35236 [Diplonema papillatum]